MYFHLICDVFFLFFGEMCRCAGIPWRDLPVRFGDWKNVHRRLRRWCESGVIERIFRHLAADRANEYMMIDSTIVRAHQHSAGAHKKGMRIRLSGDPVVD
ncbi:hypothetical protein AD951_03960 [Acetobacter malorum]|uniref:Insertion element IS402-like domain-containing protein n=1 Tax=Acetobacter malorum TaxID=178901 RepID=A0A149UQ97_9PROT|nr:hypothetical protein AD951_03960 [Acetobacter malorum]